MPPLPLLRPLPHSSQHTTHIRTEHNITQHITTQPHLHTHTHIMQRSLSLSCSGGSNPARSRHFYYTTVTRSVFDSNAAHHFTRAPARTHTLVRCNATSATASATAPLFTTHHPSPTPTSATGGGCPFGYDKQSPPHTTAVPTPLTSTSSPQQQQQQQHTGEESARVNPVIDAKPFDSIPGPKGWPVVGVLPEFLRNFSRRQLLLDEYYQKYGNIVKFSVAGFNQVFLFDPDLIQEVTKIEPTLPKRQPLPVWVKYRETRGKPMGIALSQDEEWKRHRTVVNKFLLPQTVDTQVPRVWDVAQKLVGRLKQTIDPVTHTTPVLREVGLAYGLEAVIAALMGRKMGLLAPEGPPPQSQKFIDSVVGLFDTSDKLTFGFPWWKLWDTPMLKQHFKYWDDMYETGASLHSTATATKENVYDDGAPNLMDLVVSSDSNHQLTPIEVEGLSIDLLSAGVDTTANSLTFALYHLGKNQDVQEKLYQEVSSVIGDGADVTAAKLRKMNYLKNTVTESMRINPTVESNARYFTKDVVIGGYHIPAMTYVGLSTWTAGRSEANYANPLKFDPDRHNRSGSGKEKEHHPFSSLPFGAGARACPGRRIALIELQLAVANIIRNWRVVYPHEAEVNATMLMKPVYDKPVIFLPRV
eukprot:TRINITY_DN935_c0_g1_i4.p1 TRINITY_DN935_c0_g1~~TRINITY_DN935_c0_g1_i4.p1  ORF type:complete len:642 (-),score=103.38 TRINITY_DN935_c0_g1_i4:30-1955(-)